MKNHAIKITSSLRDKGMFVDIDLNDKPLKKQMEQSIDSKFAIIVAPNEFANGMIVLRNMLDRSEKQIKVEDLFSELSS
jgi:histidyl-tRNA synthetase